MNDFLTDFPPLSRFTYLNTAYTGLLPASSYRWRREHDECFFEEGSLFRDDHRRLFSLLRDEAAAFFGTVSQNVALVPNFSFGLNVLLDGLSAGLSVLLLEGDYPSVNWAVEHRDFDVCYAPFGTQVEDHILRVVESKRPDLFVFSAIHYVTGIRISESFLGKLKEGYPDMLMIADGTQYLGTTDFDFDRSPFDAIGGSGYKWMLSGFGNGLFLIKPEAQKKIHPRTVGFNSADAVDGRPADIPFFGRFEPGHQDTLAFGTMLQSLRYLQSIGTPWIERRVRELSTYATERLSGLGLIDGEEIDQRPLSPILYIPSTAVDVEGLRKQGVICSQRADGIRLSFHFYNQKDDIDRLIALWKKH